MEFLFVEVEFCLLFIWKNDILLFCAWEYAVGRKTTESLNIEKNEIVGSGEWSGVNS